MTLNDIDTRLKQIGNVLGSCSLEGDDKPGLMHEIYSLAIMLLGEVKAYREGGLTEEILRRQDGYIKLGRGCCVVIDSIYQEMESEWEAMREQLQLANIDALNNEARANDLERKQAE